MIYLLLPILLFLTACGDGGTEDTILTGFSGVLIFGIVAWVIWRYASKKRSGS